MRKNILFVIDSLHCAGAEKSLTTLLNLIDYSKYSVDLQLFGYGGEFEKLLPNEVNLLKPLEYTRFTSIPLNEAVLKVISIKKLKMLYSRVKYSREIRKEQYTHAEKARVFWQCTEKVFPIVEKEYDIAISYAQGIPTFYTADKVKAKKKFAWVNTSYILNDIERNFQKEYYLKYTKIVTVSHSAKDIFLNTFPEFSKKVEIIYDINDYAFINKMSNVEDSDIKLIKNFDGIKIVTLGRLASGKRYDRALDACKKLIEKGVNFKWYALGIGPLESEIRKLISKNKLEEHFILLGIKSNPYPYIKNCDIYVQTSDFEGFGLAIAEARMLNKPVVTTRFDAVFTQMVDRKNGLVVDMNGQSICDGILELINNEELKLKIIDYLKSEKKGNVEELDKFYELIG